MGANRLRSCVLAPYASGGERIEEPGRGAVSGAQSADTNQRRHDVMPIGAMAQADHVPDLMQGNCSYTGCVQRSPGTHVGREGDLAVAQPAVAIRPPGRGPGLVVQEARPSYADLGTAW